MRHLILAVCLGLLGQTVNSKVLIQTGKVKYIQSFDAGPDREVVLTFLEDDILEFNLIENEKVSSIASIPGVRYIGDTQILKPAFSPDNSWMATWIFDSSINKLERASANFYFLNLETRKIISLNACDYILKHLTCSNLQDSLPVIYFDHSGDYALLEIQAGSQRWAPTEWANTRENTILKINLRTGAVSNLYRGSLRLIPLRHESELTGSNGGYGGFGILPNNRRFLGMVGIQFDAKSGSESQIVARMDLSNFAIQEILKSPPKNPRTFSSKQKVSFIHPQANMALVSLSVKQGGKVHHTLNQVDFDKLAVVPLDPSFLVLLESTALNLGWLVRRNIYKDTSLVAVDFSGNSITLGRGEEFIISPDGKYIAISEQSKPLSVTLASTDGRSVENLTVSLPIGSHKTLEQVQVFDLGAVSSNYVGLRLATRSQDNVTRDLKWERWFVRIDRTATSIIDRDYYEGNRAVQPVKPVRYSDNSAAYSLNYFQWYSGPITHVDYQMLKIRDWKLGYSSHHRRCRYKFNLKQFYCTYRDQTGSGFLEVLN